MGLNRENSFVSVSPRLFSSPASARLHTDEELHQELIFCLLPLGYLHASLFFILMSNELLQFSSEKLAPPNSTLRTLFIDFPPVSSVVQRQQLHSGLSEGQKHSWRQQLCCLDNNRDQKQKETSGLSAHFPSPSGSGHDTLPIIHPHPTSMTGRCLRKSPFDCNCE